MKRQSNEHEVIVLGSGLGGLVAGTLLSKKKHPVLLLKESGYLPYPIIKGYRFVPFSDFSEKRLRSALLQVVCRALRLPLFTRREEEVRQTQMGLEKSKQVSFQVILPRARVDLFSDRALSQMEWRREFPKEVGRIEDLYTEMDRLQDHLKKMKAQEGSRWFFPLQPPSLIKRWLSFRRLPRGRMDERLSRFSKEFREFIQLQLMSWGNLYSDRLPIALAAYLLLNNGLNELISDVDLEKLEENILGEYLQSGGTIEEIERVEKVDTEWRRGFILFLEGGRRIFRSDYLILNSPLHRVKNFLGKKGKRLSKWERRIQPRYVFVPLFLGIREKVIPVGMKDLLVSILDLDKPYERGNVIFLALSPKGDETKAPEGSRALTVESLMPLEKWNEHFWLEYQKEVMKHLGHLFPFLEKHIEFIDFQWANEQVPRWSYPHFLYETTSDFQWRKGIIPTRISRALYFTGRENFPYLGLEGDILSGLMVAQQILKKYS